MCKELILLCSDFTENVQAKVFSSHAEDSDSDYEDFTDDEEFQAPIDNIDPFIFFSDVMKGLNILQPVYFLCLNRKTCFSPWKQTSKDM